MQLYTIRQFFGGIAIFLYALDVLEDVAKSGGAKIQKWIESMTSTKLRSFFLGASLVNLLQSTHAVSLIILALVGGGLIGLNHAIAVVIGMNVGSVFMEALIGLFGLGFDMHAIIMPMIAIGGLGAFFTKKYRSWFLVLMSLGLVFLGLEFMKDSIKFLKETIDLARYTNLERWRFIVIGFVATIMTQSSSAVTIIVMTALLEHVIPFKGSAAILMGAYIASSTTAVFVAFASNSSVKKQVSLSHFLFNFTTCIVFVIFFSQIMYLIQVIWGFGTNSYWMFNLSKTSVNGLIIFFLLFKLVGGILHLPFIDQLARFLQWLIPNNQNELLGIEHVDPKLHKDALLKILNHDIDKLHKQHLELVKQWFFDPSLYNQDVYYAQKEKFDKLFQFAVQYQDNPKLIDRLQETMQALKLCKDTMRSFEKIYELKDSQTTHYLSQLHSQMHEIFSLLSTEEWHMALEKIDALSSWDEVKMQEYTHTGKPVSDAVIELIRIHDHIHSSLRCLVVNR